MSVVQAIVLGIVQGLSEFLPISSSAHLILVPWLFGWQDPGLAFDVALHWGTLVAVLAVFWRDWIGLIRAGASSILERRIGEDQDRRLFWALFLSSIPAAAHHSFGLTDVLLFAMAVIWGINFVVVKYATHVFNPVAFTGLRVGIAFAKGLAFALGRPAVGVSALEALAASLERQGPTAAVIDSGRGRTSCSK